MSKESYDYIIVGSGPAGCVLANRFSASGQLRVLLIEAGGPDNNFWVPIPLAMVKLIGNANVAWLNRTVPKDDFDGRSIILTQGKMLGGSSSLNGMLYVRGQKADYDEWAALGCDGWDWNSVLPYFKKSECLESGGTDSAHGRTGELKLSWIHNVHPSCRTVMQAALDYGLPWNDDTNDGTQGGVGYLMGTIHRGRRQSGSVAFLNPVKNRANLTVRTRAPVRRVLLEGGHAIGVEILTADGEAEQITCRREVIVAAGPIGSPQVLQRSGIGDPEHLKAVGVDPIVEASEVGNNLHDHLFGHLKLELKRKSMSLNATLNNPARMAVELLKWYATGKGVLNSTSSHFCCYMKSDPSVDREDIQVAVRPFSINITPKGELKPDTYPAMNVSAINVRPFSRGTVRITSTDPAQPADVDPGYLSDTRDVQVLTRGIRHIREILAGSAVKNVILAEREPGPDCTSDDALEAYLRSRASTVYHAVGTCRMGADPQSVVDPQLRVRGVEGLRVIDSSIMPTICSGNTNAASIMIGEKGADLVLHTPA